MSSILVFHPEKTATVAKLEDERPAESLAVAQTQI
jgi:hypothetical protein